MTRRIVRLGLAGAFAALASLAPSAAGLPDHAVSAAPSDMTRANAYDDAWEAGWVAHCRSVYRTAGKTAGFVLQIGDSITHSNPYSQWMRYGAGKTAEDDGLTTWCQAAAWGAGNGDTTSKNGCYLAAADTSGGRGMTASGGIDTDEYLYGHNNGGADMPTDLNPATAKAKVADGATYSGNLNIATVAAAFSDAQFAVLMLGTNDVGAGRSAADVSANLADLVDVLEGQNIVVVLSTIPPHPSANDTVLAYNGAIRSLAQSRGLPLVDFYEEILLRRPGTSWNGTLLGSDDVHPSASGGGYGSASDPYTPGGDPATHTTGDACLNVGYLLRSWLTVQKLKEVKRYVADGVDPPTGGGGGEGGGGGGGKKGGCWVSVAEVNAGGWLMPWLLLAGMIGWRHGKGRR